MKTPLHAFAAALAFALPAAAVAGDEGPDVTKLYQVSTEGSTARLGAGEKGKLVLTIALTEPAYLSDETPLKISLSGTNGAAPEKSALAYADQVSKPKAGQKYANPVVFEVPFSVAAPPSGKATATVDAKMTFFVCTKEICSRQQKQVSLPVTVCRGAAGTC